MTQDSKKEIKFDDYSWHDSNIISMRIDRSSPGIKDSIYLEVLFPESLHTCLFEFYDCYKLISNMNFGIIADESILKVECYKNHPILENLKSIWKNKNLPELNCYVIHTNSTNSLIQIVSIGFKVNGAVKGI